MCHTTFAFLMCLGVLCQHTNHNLVSLCTFFIVDVALFARFSTGTVVICNSSVVRPDSIVTDVLVLNKHQNISDHRVDYIVSLGLNMNHITTYWYCWAGTRYASDVRLRPLCHLPYQVSAQNPASASLVPVGSSRCNVISGILNMLKPDPILRGKRCTGLTRPVDNQWQRSKWEGRRLRWCHLSATLGTDYPRAAVNSMPSQVAVSHGANSMSPCSLPPPEPGASNCGRCRKIWRLTRK